MKPSAMPAAVRSREIALSVDNGFDVVAVWEREGKRWRLLQLARPGQAIALYQENPKARLVFPTEINPNHLEQNILKAKITKGKVSNYSLGAKR